MAKGRAKNTTFAEFEAAKNTAEITLENFDFKLSRFLNTCNRVYDTKDSKKFLLKFYPDEVIEAIDEISYSGYQTLGFIAKFIEENKLNLDFHPETKRWFLEKVNELKSIKKERAPKNVESLKERGQHIQQAIINRVRDTMGEIDQYIDDNKFKKAWGKEFDIVEYLKSKELSGIHGRKMVQRLQVEQDEFKNIENDEQLKEGYSFLNKKQISYIIGLYDYVITEIERFITFEANKRKQVKKPKAAKIENALKDFKYLKEFEEFHMASSNPAEIIGSQIVVLYNTKYRCIKTIVAADKTGLQIKGTTIYNTDDKECKEQTLRKPKEMLEVISKASKREFTKFIDSLTTKQTLTNSRCNGDCLIVNIYR